MDISKSGLRQLFLERRDGLEERERAKASQRIIESVVRLDAYKGSTNIGLFYSLENEIDLRMLIAETLEVGKRVYLPRVNSDESRLEFCPYTGDIADLVPGPFGILEPKTREIAPEQISFITVPGLAFDLHGHRLGYGAGYYDRFLSASPAFSAGVTFDIQTIDILPITEHDIAVNVVVTETRLISS